MLKLATIVYTYPSYNVRYSKFLNEFSKRFEVSIFVGSSFPSQAKGHKLVPRLFYPLPFKTPKKVCYIIGPLLGRFWINLMNPNIVWLFDTTGPLLPLVFNKPIVLDIDDPIIVMPQKISRLLRLKEYRLLREKKVVKIIVTTKMIRHKFIKLGVNAEKIEIIPSGVDVNLFRPTPLPEEPIILYYGTFQEHRAKLLAEVIMQVCKLNEDARFLLIGFIPAQFQQYIKRMGLLNRVKMIGYIDHDKLPRWLEKARVCLFPQDRSLGGRLSIKLLEYMAAGRPIVATNVDESFPVKESGAGILTPVDPKAIAEAIIMLLNDKKLAEKMIERGISYARRFDWEKLIKKYIKIIQEVAGIA